MYEKTDGARTIHSPRRSHSSKNLQNRIAEFTKSGLFVWFSSDTASLDHASVMSYGVEGDSVQSWFASFQKIEGNWKVSRVKGVAEAEVKVWFPLA